MVKSFESKRFQCRVDCNSIIFVFLTYSNLQTTAPERTQTRSHPNDAPRPVRNSHPHQPRTPSESSQKRRQMTTHHPRTHPIILLTGTPGTGKSTHAQLIAAASSSSSSSSGPGGQGEGEEEEGCEFEHINVSELVKEKGFHEGWDEEWSSWILDEDKVRGFGPFGDGIRFGGIE